MTRVTLIAAALVLSMAALRAAAADSTLADAAEKVNRAQVRALLEARVAVDAAQIDGMTALHWATYHDDAEMVEQLLRAGANVQAATRYGVTPLSLACTNGNGALVERLLAAGADPNAALPGGETPLMTAARTGSLVAVRTLLSRGAKVDATDEARGQTALMWAAAEGHVDVVQALIASGADVRRHLASGFTPLLFAVRELSLIHKTEPTRRVVISYAVFCW
jgi:ankyrin repeat protein